MPTLAETGDEVWQAQSPVNFFKYFVVIKEIADKGLNGSLDLLMPYGLK